VLIFDTLGASLAPGGCWKFEAVPIEILPQPRHRHRIGIHSGLGRDESSHHPFAGHREVEPLASPKRCPVAVWACRLQSYSTFWLAHEAGRCTLVASPSTHIIHEYELAA